MPYYRRGKGRWRTDGADVTLGFRERSQDHPNADEKRSWFSPNPILLQIPSRILVTT